MTQILEDYILLVRDDLGIVLFRDGVGYDVNGEVVDILNEEELQADAEAWSETNILTTNPLQVERVYADKIRDIISALGKGVYGSDKELNDAVRQHSIAIHYMRNSTDQTVVLDDQDAIDLTARWIILVEKITSLLKEMISDGNTDVDAKFGEFGVLELTEDTMTDLRYNEIKITFGVA